METAVEKYKIYTCYYSSDVLDRQAFGYHLKKYETFIIITERQTIPVGQTSENWVFEAIEACDLFVIFVSVEAINDPAVEQDIEKAILLKKEKVFLAVKPCTFDHLLDEESTRHPEDYAISEKIPEREKTWMRITNIIGQKAQQHCHLKNNKIFKQQGERNSFFERLEQQLVMEEKYWKKASFLFIPGSKTSYAYDFLSKQYNALIDDRQKLEQSEGDDLRLREILSAINDRMAALSMLLRDTDASEMPVFRTVLAVQEEISHTEKALNQKGYGTSSNTNVMDRYLMALDICLKKLSPQLKKLIDETLSFGPN
jgi:hypothetical protein